MAAPLDPSGAFRRCFWKLGRQMACPHPGKIMVCFTNVLRPGAEGARAVCTQGTWERQIRSHWTPVLSFQTNTLPTSSGLFCGCRRKARTHLGPRVHIPAAAAPDDWQGAQDQGRQWGALPCRAQEGCARRPRSCGRARKLGSPCPGVHLPGDGPQRGVAGVGLTALSLAASISINHRSIQMYNFPFKYINL